MGFNSAFKGLMVDFRNSAKSELGYIYKPIGKSTVYTQSHNESKKKNRSIKMFADATCRPDENLLMPTIWHESLIAPFSLLISTAHITGATATPTRAMRNCPQRADVTNTTTTNTTAHNRIGNKTCTNTESDLSRPTHMNQRNRTVRVQNYCI